MECPDETTLSDFLAGWLSEERRARVLAHVEGCPRCERALAEDEDFMTTVNARDAASRASAPLLAPGATLSRYVAEAHLGLHAPEQAAPLLERARQVYARTPGDPLDQAWATFLLARALGERRPNPDRTRAAALAEEARAQMNRLGLGARVELQKLTDWQARHRPRSPAAALAPHGEGGR